MIEQVGLRDMTIPTAELHWSVWRMGSSYDLLSILFLLPLSAPSVPSVFSVPAVLSVLLQNKSWRGYGVTWTANCPNVIIVGGRSRMSERDGIQIQETLRVRVTLGTFQF